MGRHFIGDDDNFKDLSKLVPTRGCLQVENNRLRGVIRERQGKYHFETMEFVREAGAGLSATDVVVFTALANRYGELEKVFIRKGSWVSTPSPHLAEKIVRERILGPIADLMLGPVDQGSGEELPITQE